MKPTRSGQKGSALALTLLPLLLALTIGGITVLTAYQDFQQSLWKCRETAFKSVTQSENISPPSAVPANFPVIVEAQKYFLQKGGSLAVKESKDKYIALAWTTESEVLFPMQGSCSYDDQKKELH